MIYSLIIVHYKWSLTFSKSFNHQLTIYAYPSLLCKIFAENIFSEYLSNDLVTMAIYSPC